MKARVRRVGAWPRKRLPLRLARPSLCGKHQRGADLGRGRSGSKHGGDPGCRCDAACGDERSIGHRREQLEERQDRERLVVVLPERALVTAGLGALHDERVGTRVEREPRLGPER